MSHLSQTLERLIEIISVEKLVGLIEKNTNINEIPIISPKPNITQTNITVKDYSDDIAKIQEQLVAINSSLLSLSEAIKNVVIGNNECRPVANSLANPDTNSVNKVVEEEHIRLNIEEKICCLPTVAHTISETVNVEDITDNEDEDVSDNEEEEEEEVVVESEEEEEEDISDNKVEAKEEEEEAEEESEPEVGVESEEEVEEDEVSETEVEAKVDISDNKVESKEEEEEEVFEIEIDDVTYYATSEENGILYEVDKDGEVGKQVGIIKDGEPIFS